MFLQWREIEGNFSRVVYTLVEVASTSEYSERAKDVRVVDRRAETIPGFREPLDEHGSTPSGEVGVKCTKFTDAITNRPKNSITYSKLSNDDERIAGTRRKLKELEETWNGFANLPAPLSTH